MELWNFFAYYDSYGRENDKNYRKQDRTCKEYQNTDAVYSKAVTDPKRLNPTVLYSILHSAWAGKSDKELKAEKKNNDSDNESCDSGRPFADREE